MLAGAEGGLEEGGAQKDNASLTHFGLTAPLAALLETRVIAHEGLEAGGGLASRVTGKDLRGEPTEDLGGKLWTEAWDGGEEVALRGIERGSGQLLD